MLLFFLVTLGLCGWHLHHGANDNTLSRAAMVAAVAQNGTLSIDPWKDLTHDRSLINGHYYSDKAPLPALVMIPVWWTVTELGIMDPAAEGVIPKILLGFSGFVCGSIPMALIMTLFWLRIQRRPGRVPPALLAVLPFLGSFLFVFSGAFFGHLLGAALLLGSWVALDNERPLLSGMLAAAAVLCEYPLFVFPLVWVVYQLILRKWRTALFICLGGLPFVIAILLYNAILTGSMFSIGYDHLADYAPDGYGLGVPTPEALWGLTFSDYRGLFFYMPVLLLALMALFSSRDEKRLWRDPIIIACVMEFLLIAGHGMWWGGWSYGPRHLTAVAVMLAWRSWPALANTRWARWPFFITSGLGLLCAIAAKSTCWFAIPSEPSHPMTSIVWWHLVRRSFTDMQLPALAGFSGALSTAMFIVVLIFSMRLLVKRDRTLLPSA